MSFETGSINLLPATSRWTPGAGRSERFLVAGGTAVFVFVLALAFGAATLSYSLNRSLAAAETENQQLLSRIVARSALEQRQVLIADRVLEADRLLDGRERLRQAVKDLLALVPDGVTISQVSGGASTPKVVISILSPSYVGLPEVLSAVSVSRFSTVQVLAISREDNGDYVVDIEVS